MELCLYLVSAHTIYRLNINKTSILKVDQRPKRSMCMYVHLFMLNQIEVTELTAKPETTPLEKGSEKMELCLYMVNHFEPTADPESTPPRKRVGNEQSNFFFSRGEMAACWYILLSGAVFIDGSMFLPRAR